MKKKLILGLCLIALLSLVLFVVACGGGGSYEDSSSTNVQVEGIDEPDIVKVTADGYIFKVQSDGFTVSKALDGYMEVVNQTSIVNFIPKEIFINKNCLIVIGESDEKTALYFYDISELTNIEEGEILINSKEKRVSVFDGQYFTARIYNDVFYLVVSDYYTESKVTFKDTFQGEKAIERIKIFDTSSKGTMFTVAKLELNSFSENYLINTYEGDIKDLYCSPYAIYAIGFYGSSRVGCRTNYSTKITKISYNNLEVEADVDIPKTVKDRFSLYDNGKNLFVVSFNRESTLSAYDKNLEFLSSINFAYGETLYSVRYEEGFCYVVTFKQIDPLFKIDISNPENLKIVGELEIPGFSNYMQGFGADRMIGIGYDRDIRRGVGSAALKVSLFDTSKDEPKEINNIIFNTGTSSLAYSNPRAILCEVENNVFAFEVTQKDSGKVVKQSIFVLGIKDGMLVVRANLSSLDYNSKSDKSRSYFTRITRINEYLYAISEGYIVSFNLNNFNKIDVLDTRIKKEMFTVSFVTYADYTLTNTIEEGKKVSEPENIIKDGYTLEGWFIDVSLKVPYDFNSPVNKNLTLFAKWKSV